MAESNATQVILTDDGIKIIKAQNTADNAASGITNLNDPNLMSVIEKQNNIGQFAGLTSQYNVLVQNAKDDGIDTTAVTTAYNNLNKFMADVLADPSHAGDIDRVTYKKYQDAYNEELAKIQSALQNNANNKFTSAANATSQAASTASQAFVQAQSAVDYANTAIANDKVTSQAVTDLKGGSKLTIQQLQDGLATKIESSDFKSYQKQAADMFVSEVSFNSMTISNRNLALGTATPFKMNGNNTENQLQGAYKFSKVIPRGTVVTVTFDVSSSTGVGDFTMQFNGSDPASSWQPIYNSNLVNGTKHVSTAITADSDHLSICPRLDHATGDVTFSNFIISESSKEVSWTPAPEDTQSQFTQLADKINLRVTKDGLISQINLQAKNTLISSGGQLTLSGKNIYFDTDHPVIIPSANISKLLVDKKLEAADISANTFTINNGTFTVKQDGSITAKNMTLTGGTLTLPTINTSKINSSTINGTTFYGGDIINNPNNTAKYYPMTITPDGTYKSTYFDSAVGLQSSVESGAISYKYRSMTDNGGWQYLAYDSVINGQGFESQSGYTSVKDATFSNTETITGYVNVTPSSGIYLYGPTQKINFAGRAGDIGSNGSTMDAYGNIFGQANSWYWRIGDANANAIADFGFDTANKRNISLYRDTQVGNLFLGVGHTIGMLDSSPLYFKKGDSNGRMLGLYAGAIHYENLIKSSLLSVKQDVKKADTAYWAQLVNSIDLATYQYKTDDNTSHIRLSSIVDDVNDTKQWQLPDVFVSRDEDGKLCGVDDSVLLNATLATVQEQQKEIDQLNGHNMELEARLNKLEAKLNG